MKSPGNKSEATILKEVLSLLNSNKIWHMRLGTTGIPIRENGKLKLVPNPGEAGKADILVIVSSEKGLRVIWLETKTKTGRQSDAQKLFELRVKKAGCEYYLIRDREEVVRILEL